MNSKALTIDNLAVGFDGTDVISKLHLEVEAGEILCLLGPSGGGKTSVLKAIAGLLDSGVSGQIQVFNQTVLDGKKNIPAEKRNIGFIFQDYALFPHMTVADNVSYGISYLSREEREKRVQESLSLVELAHLENRFPHELSGGQQQRVTVARSLACKPKLLLMDEPFSNIDTQVKRRLMTDLKRLLKEHNITVIFVTHTKAEAFAFADRVAVLQEGKVQQLASPQAVFEAPTNAFVAKFMESGNLIACKQYPEVWGAPPFPEPHQPIFDQGYFLFVPSQMDICLTDKSPQRNEKGFFEPHCDTNAGYIVDKQYIGNGFEYEVRYNGTNWKVHQNMNDFQINDCVTIVYRGRPQWIAP